MMPFDTTAPPLHGGELLEQDTKRLNARLTIDSAPSKNCTVPVSSGALFGAQALTMYVSRTSPDVALAVAFTAVVVTLRTSRAGTPGVYALALLDALPISPL